jgi:DNA-3-methyladenine glycosylase II
VYFEYGEIETAYLKSKDKLLGEVIEKIGPIYREVNMDLFSSVVHHIIGQQISTAAQKTIWNRLVERLCQVNTETICNCSVDALQQFGMTFRKAEYIRNFAEKVKYGEFDMEALNDKSDEEVIAALSALKGIGVWTAEMIMIFCMQRPNVMSYGDLAIHRGLRMLYHHRKLDVTLFEKYRRRYSPYGTVASLYLWAVAGGGIAEMKDYAVKKKLSKNIRRA